MIAEVTHIGNVSMMVIVHDSYENRTYRSAYLLEVLEEQRPYVIVGDIVELVTHPTNQNTSLGRIRRRPVPNLFYDLYRQTERPEEPDINDEAAVRRWNDYVYLERAAIDRFRDIPSDSGVNWIEEGF